MDLFFKYIKKQNYINNEINNSNYIEINIVLAADFAEPKLHLF